MLKNNICLLVLLLLNTIAQGSEGDRQQGENVKASNQSPIIEYVEAVMPPEEEVVTPSQKTEMAILTNTHKELEETTGNTKRAINELLIEQYPPLQPNVILPSISYIPSLYDLSSTASLIFPFLGGQLIGYPFKQNNILTTPPPANEKAVPGSYMDYYHQLSRLPSFSTSVMQEQSTTNLPKRKRSGIEENSEDEQDFTGKKRRLNTSAASSASGKEKTVTLSTEISEKVVNLLPQAFANVKGKTTASLLNKDMRENTGPEILKIIMDVFNEIKKIPSSTPSSLENINLKDRINFSVTHKPSVTVFLQIFKLIFADSYPEKKEDLNFMHNKGTTFYTSYMRTLKAYQAATTPKKTSSK